MLRRTTIVVCILLCLGLVALADAQQVDTSLIDLDQKIASWMKEWHVPGMAVGVVKNGETLLYKGYGVRNVETGAPVTPNTVFRIASNSKAFTSLSAALLVDAGKLGWDQPVVEIVPDFKTADSLASLQMSIRDMLCHRTGLPEHFMLYDIYPTDRERLFYTLRYVKPSFGFRQRYRYNNVVYAAAGYIVGRVADMSWENFVQTHVFDPLNMGTASFGLDIQRAAESAYPYYYKDGRFHLHEFEVTPSSNPAGGINASLDDMLKWLNIYLNHGKVGETQFVSEKNLNETCTPQIPTKFVPWSATSPMEAYGLGWNIEVYRGHTFIDHGGELTDRYSSWVAWLPREKIGIVVLSNSESMLPYYLNYIIADRLTGVDISFWDAILAQEAERQGGSSEGEPARSAVPTSLAESVQGIYSNPAYGRAEVRVSDTLLTIYLGDQVRIPLSYVNDSTLMALYEKYGYPFEVSLTRGKQGRVTSFRGAFCPWDEVEFRRVSGSGQ